jgi:hypothetical protein
LIFRRYDEDDKEEKSRKGKGEKNEVCFASCDGLPADNGTGTGRRSTG